MSTARIARERGYRYIHSANEPALIAGVATCALEILEAQPSIDTARNLVEPAGAAPLAAVLAAPERFAGRSVAIVCSGGNISPEQLVSLWPATG